MKTIIAALTFAAFAYFGLSSNDSVETGVNNVKASTSIEARAKKAGVEL